MRWTPICPCWSCSDKFIKTIRTLKTLQTLRCDLCRSEIPPEPLTCFDSIPCPPLTAQGTSNLIPHCLYQLLHFTECGCSTAKSSAHTQTHTSHEWLCGLGASQWFHFFILNFWHNIWEFSIKPGSWVVWRGGGVCHWVNVWWNDADTFK